MPTRIETIEARACYRRPGQALGTAGGRSWATISLLKLIRLCEPSQNGFRSEWPQRQSDNSDLLQFLNPFNPFTIIIVLVLGGVFRSVFGRLFGSIATGGLIGVVAWFIFGSLILSGIAGVIALVFTMLSDGITAATPRGRGSGWSGGSSGSSWGGSSGGSSSSDSGGFSGGGGSFGGGGASGSW